MEVWTRLVGRHNYALIDATVILDFTDLWLALSSPASASVTLRYTNAIVTYPSDMPRTGWRKVTQSTSKYATFFCSSAQSFYLTPRPAQDLVSRFTLDSATEFLFGTNVGSLAAGIPYSPLSAKHNPALFLSHPSNIFIQGFVEGQVRSALRYSLGSEWPLGAEFWMDKVSPMRKVMDEFAEPLMNAALSRRDKRLAKGSASGIEIYDEATNLLDHLVEHTQGRLLEYLPK